MRPNGCGCQYFASSAPMLTGYGSPSFLAITNYSALRTPHSAFRIPHSALRTSHFALRTPHSALRIPHSTLAYAFLFAPEYLLEETPTPCGQLITHLYCCCSRPCSAPAHSR